MLGPHRKVELDLFRQECLISLYSLSYMPLNTKNASSSLVLRHGRLVLLPCALLLSSSTTYEVLQLCRAMK